MELNKKYIFKDLEFDNKEDFFGFLSNKLYKDGFVKESYGEGLIQREIEYPTGLPLPIGVAIPHTDASFVKKNTFTVSIFKKPIKFNEMAGDEGSTVDVKVAINIVMSDGQKHLEVLQNLIEKIQDNNFVETIANSDSDEEIINLFKEI